MGTVCLEWTFYVIHIWGNVTSNSIFTCSSQAKNTALELYEEDGYHQYAQIVWKHENDEAKDLWNQKEWLPQLEIVYQHPFLTCL